MFGENGFTFAPPNDNNDFLGADGRQGYASNDDYLKDALAKGELSGQITDNMSNLGRIDFEGKAAFEMVAPGGQHFAYIPAENRLVSLD